MSRSLGTSSCLLAALCSAAGRSGPGNGTWNGAAASRSGRGQGGRPADPSERPEGRGAGAARRICAACPPQTLYPMLLDQMIDGRRWSPRRRSQASTRTRPCSARSPAAEDRALQTAMLSKEVGPTVTDDAVHARYDQDIAGKPGEEEVHAKHILVDNEAEAKKIIAELKGGARLRGAGQAVQQGSQRGAAGRRSGLLQEGRDGAGIRHRRLRPAARPGIARAGTHPVRLACHPVGRAPPRRSAELRPGARRIASEDDPGGRSEGGGQGARRGVGGEVQPGRLAGARNGHAEPPPAASASQSSA